MKPHDIVVFGATGFTGRLVAEYLASGEGAVRWAIAGRDTRKLEELSAELASRFGVSVPVVRADVSDPASLLAMARDTQVVLTTVGPYGKYGEPVVSACVEGGADYLDLTGEPDFVGRMIRKYGGRAEGAGVRMIPCCGFESVPTDLGIYFAVDRLCQNRGPLSELDVQTYMYMGGSFSGGTWQSMLEIVSKRRQEGIPRPSSSERVVELRRQMPHVAPDASGWVVPMPTLDPMIVARSAGALEFYGRRVSIGCNLRTGSLLGTAEVVAGGAAVVALAQLRVTRKLLERVRRPGQGPTPAERQRGFFRLTVAARSGDEKIVARVSGGDPGYGETAKMISEAALALVLDRERLPKRRGFLTPAVAFGGVLVERLENAGIRFEVVRRTPAVVRTSEDSSHKRAEAPANGQ
ncbi:MAG: saccharopine dehydrogenase NADP-binding domain-containing protein [Polyangiaceae bacterium]